MTAKGDKPQFPRINWAPVLEKAARLRAFRGATVALGERSAGVRISPLQPVI